MFFRRKFNKLCGKLKNLILPNWKPSMKYIVFPILARYFSKNENKIIINQSIFFKIWNFNYKANRTWTSPVLFLIICAKPSSSQRWRTFLRRCSSQWWDENFQRRFSPFSRGLIRSFFRFETFAPAYRAHDYRHL